MSDERAGGRLVAPDELAYFPCLERALEEVQQSGHGQRLRRAALCLGATTWLGVVAVVIVVRSLVELFGMELT